ncbi:3-hydroxyacyl-CoA dehydrogenase NAD-binding domain-containing protein [Heyndrickxia sp. FSL K6-6286]|uniref:3-hydroxyacyl-CoA dehydrogenase NAD-binding domain-containing protein n=1 Tax=Heyndrickxia sp. FSL K6-6286 TaxID=2921510 RepID=UPI003159AB43
MMIQSKIRLPDELQRFNPVTVIGAGTIGVSWTALFLAYGLTVRVNDPRPDVKEVVLNGIDQIKPTLKALGLPTEGLTNRLEIEPDLDRALQGAAVIQENGPERLEFKHELFSKIEKVVSKETLLLSSSSGIPSSEIAKGMKNPERLLIGHPFNPPHLVPLVEVVPGEYTKDQAVQDAITFYRALGKEPMVLEKEIPGFVANRLQSALFREAVNLVLEGVVSMEDLDRIVTNSIGLRWAVGGPFLTFHLGGGKGGLPAFLQHLGPNLQNGWKNLGNPNLDEANVQTLSNHAMNSYGNVPIEQLEKSRDQKQLSVLKMLKDQQSSR